MLRRVIVAAAARQGPRNYMEDMHTLIPDFNLQLGRGGGMLDDGIQRTYVAVFDGHSGKAAALTAAARLHQYLASNPKMRHKAGAEVSGDEVPDGEEKDIADALRSAFVSTDGDILGSTSSGSTAVVGLRTNHTLYVAHAGDSRAVLCSGGAAEQLTEDHKPSLPREAARITARGGVIDYRTDRVVSRRSRLNMSRALGDPSHKTGPVGQQVVEARPDVGVVDLRPADEFVILATDGLWDYVGNQEACTLVRLVVAPEAEQQFAGVDPQQVAQRAVEKLVDAAVAAGTHDNVTAAIMLFSWA